MCLDKKLLTEIFRLSFFSKLFAKIYFLSLGKYCMTRLHLTAENSTSKFSDFLHIILLHSEDSYTHFTLRYRIGRNRNGMNFSSLDQ